MTTPMDGRWHPGIGDPNATGWITVVAYAAAMVLCYLCQRQAPPVPHRHFWFVMMLAMAALGINKQLDLQTWMTELGRDLAMHYGWYAQRRTVQTLFIVALVVVGFGLIAWLGQRLKELDGYARRAAYGMVVLGVFVLVRASSFHHVDMLLGFRWNNIAVNAILELGGISAIVHSAWGRWRASRPNR
ncbi:MAG: hypothetical protein ABIZ09_14820 [Rhodoferax sp.]